MLYSIKGYVQIDKWVHLTASGVMKPGRNNIIFDTSGLVSLKSSRLRAAVALLSPPDKRDTSFRVPCGGVGAPQAATAVILGGFGLSRPSTFDHDTATLTDNTMALRGLLEDSSDADMLREMAGFAAVRLMALEVGGLTGAGHGERSGNGSKQRNGYREGEVAAYGSARRQELSSRILLEGAGDAEKPQAQAR